MAAEMSHLENLTRFAATCLPSLSRADELLTLVIVSGRFKLPRVGATAAELTVVDEQGEVGVADEYAGDPAALELVHEGQSTYTRPGTDIYLHGRAWAPGRKPVIQSSVELWVGPVHKSAVVVGDRMWQRSLGGIGPSRPVPFTAIPLSYSRCFGGAPVDPSRADAEAGEHNPIGCGLYRSAREAVDRPLPNFEDPRAPIRSLGDRPPACGFGPVARHWRPRRTFAGTYDRAWQDERMPLWPADLDERFFCAAAPGLCARPHLQGGETVRIAGMDPDGAHEFALPGVRLEARFEVGSSSIRRRLVLDAISFELDASSFVMTWRAYVAADPLTISMVVVRTLAPGEGGP